MPIRFRRPGKGPYFSFSCGQSQYAAPRFLVRSLKPWLSAGGCWGGGMLAIRQSRRAMARLSSARRDCDIQAIYGPAKLRNPRLSVSPSIRGPPNPAAPPASKARRRYRRCTGAVQTQRSCLCREGGKPVAQRCHPPSISRHRRGRARMHREVDFRRPLPVGLQNWTLGGFIQSTASDDPNRLYLRTCLES